MTDEPKLVWVENGDESYVVFDESPDGLGLDVCGQDDQWWADLDVFFCPDTHPTREAAKLAAEAEARRIGMRLLAATGFDDAAVERAVRKQIQEWSKGQSHHDDMRAALAAAVKEN